MPFQKGVTPPGAKPFKKGQSGNPAGKPRKIVSACMALGYKRQEVIDTLSVMIAYTLDELKEVYQNKNSTLLELTIANALRKSLEKGSLYTIDSILDRLFGKATEKLDVDANVTQITIKRER